jgi:cell division septation protein DedD
MNDHNLDDLIIDNIEPKNGKAKSLLTIVALLIVVLIVAIILTKIILKDPNESNISVDNSTEMISPELTLQNVGKKKEVKEETKLSSIIEKELNEPVKAPEVKAIVEAEKPVQIKEPKAEAVKETAPKAESVEITKEFDQSPAVPETKPEVKESPKAIVAQETKPTPVPEKKVETITSVSRQIYYVQVGSFSQAPSQSLLRVIKNNGFKYRIKTAGKTKKVQIGPFKDRSSADTALIRIKDRIKKDSFVVKK